MFFYEDYVLSYEELLQKAGKEAMKVNRLRSLYILKFASWLISTPRTWMKFLS